MRYPFPLIARENWPLLALVLCLGCLVFSYLSPAAALVCGAGLALAAVFRDPPRAVPAQPGAVLCPADGRVVRIDKARDPYADREALRISVSTGVFDAPVNRASVDGVIRQVRYEPGPLVSANLDPAAQATERNALVIESNGQLVTLVQVAGLMARRILCFVKAGDTLTRGQRYGLIRFGARVDVYLPPHAVPKVAPGDKVSATTTILATLSKA